MGLSQDIFFLPAYIDRMLPDSPWSFHDKSNFHVAKENKFLIYFTVDYSCYYN